MFDFTIDDDLTDIVFAVTRNTGSGTLEKDSKNDNSNQFISNVDLQVTSGQSSTANSPSGYLQ